MESILAKVLGQEPGQPTVAEKRELLQRLLARLAHEIRNPLSSLDVHVQLLEEDIRALLPAAGEQLTARLEIIHGELHRLESIVSHFLRLAGPSELDLEPVEIPKIITHVCELLRPEAAARGIEITVKVEPDIPRVLGDPVRLNQALLNVVINGMQAVAHKGMIEVRAVLHGGKVALVVRDNGPGIPQEKLASIFDPYFTTKSEGSGLGLWIAQQIVLGHGGTLRAENNPAGGAIFTLTLPVKDQSMQLNQ